MYKFANVQHFVFYCTIVKIIVWYNSQTLWNIYFCKNRENFIILHSEIRDIHRDMSDVDDFSVICFKGKKLLFGLGELRRYYAKVNKGCIIFRRQRNKGQYQAMRWYWPCSYLFSHVFNVGSMKCAFWVLEQTIINVRYSFILIKFPYDS